METGERMGGGRKRTESNGAGSDSDLSDGWNFVDQMDVNNHDAPSSDGESVEVIEADEESPEHRDGEVEEAETLPLVARLECPVVPAADQESEVSTEVEAPALREEMFDSSFCWFLFFAVSAVLVSNLAFMAAENALDWNVNVNIDSPSFLRDLPTTPKSPQQDDIANVKSWETNEEITVEPEDDEEIDVKVTKKKAYERSKRVKDEKIKQQKHSGSKFQSCNDEIDNHEFDKYFKRLSDITDSPEVQNKFSQALLILDALHVGLKDLEEVVTENSELFPVLKTQKDKLNSAMKEIVFGVSRSMERLSSNILNKVQKLERRFENQWCKLEKNGHKQELESLFYDCEETDTEHDNDKDVSKSNEQKSYSKLNNRIKKEVTEQHDHYQVDKDSTGKVYLKPESRNEGSGGYDKWMKNGKYVNKKHNKNHKNEKPDKKRDVDKQKFSEERGDSSHKYKKVDKDEVYKTNEVNPSEKLVVHTRNHPNNEFFKNKKESRYDHAKHEYNLRRRAENKKVENDKRSSKYESDNKRYQTKYENPTTDKAGVESLGKYLKENCQRNLNDQTSKFANTYEKIKDKIRVTKELFETMYDKYCRINKDSFKWGNKFKNENLKGDYSGKFNDKRNFIKNDPVVIEDSSLLDKDAIEVSVIDMSEDSKQGMDHSQKNTVIEPRKKPPQWMFSYDSSSSKTNISGDWFIKVGESRSKVRWSHHRSDWLFDRASHRRNQPQAPSWLMGRHKNWFFRRAWARQQCRQNPHATWCHVPQDETITIPNSGSNFR